MATKKKVDAFLESISPEKLAEKSEKKLVGEMESIPLEDKTLRTALLKHAEEVQRPLAGVVEEMVFDYLFRKGEVTEFDKHYIKVDDYERQVDVLSNLLVSYERDMLREAAEANGLKRWQQLLSYVRYCLSSGMAFVVQTHPEWQEGAAASETAVCKNCGGEFSLLRQGQLFCSNQCAGEYAKVNP